MDKRKEGGENEASAEIFVKLWHNEVSGYLITGKFDATIASLAV